MTYANEPIFSIIIKVLRKNKGSYEKQIGG